MIKRKFGDYLRSKTDVAMVNESLCKVTLSCSFTKCTNWNRTDILAAAIVSRKTLTDDIIRSSKVPKIMGLTYTNLDDTSRRYMLEEIAFDVAHSDLYLGKRLTDTGRTRWLSLLNDAASSHDDDWLADQQRTEGLIKAKETRNLKGGKVIEVDVPITAAETLAEGEFNRFYIRGLCRRAIDANIPSLLVYRAKDVANPRSTSQDLIGTMVDAKTLLSDLRTHQGEEPQLKMPGGPNSGLSVRLP